MSNLTYNELWKAAQTELERVLETDAYIQSAKPQKDREKARKVVTDLYVRYIVICNKLEECYDQMVQPQKRVLIKKQLDSCVGRVLELKHELVDVDLTEYNYYDDVLLKYGFTPQEAEIRIPRYFRLERIAEIEERREFIENTLRTMGAFEEVGEPQKMTESQAIRLIQAHERARQGRIRFQFMKEIHEMKEKSSMKPETNEIDEKSEKAAALKIQKIWRGYIARRAIRKRRLEEMLLIGMLQPSQIITENARQSEKIRQYRHEKQKEHEELYRTLMDETGERIRKEESAVMEENIRCEIRNWINTYFEQTGKIPDLPSVESGGSRIIFSRQGTESSISKSSSKESRRSRRSKTKKDSEPEQSEDESEPCFKPVPSNFLSELLSTIREYQDVWRSRDESSNPRQEPYRDMIVVTKSREVQDEVRRGVDQTLRGHLSRQLKLLELSARTQQ